mmetsp:Transcript_45733/g.97655  ORF Transcript_45733/g.97655 Transcript_45733/m.97655 type:complete len:300 (+) Transcript_45733:20-919(+)
MAVPSSAAFPATVRVSNVPFDAQHTQLKDILARAGPVVELRVSTDSVPGSTGVAFCEYRDHGVAASAVRNLQGVECGGQALMLSWPDDTVRNAAEAREAQLEQTSSQAPTVLRGRMALPRVDVDALSSISDVVQDVSVERLYQIMAVAQKLVQQQPDIARTLLAENPSMCAAVTHAQLLLGMHQGNFLPLSPAETACIADHEQGWRRKMAMYDPSAANTGLPAAKQLATAPRGAPAPGSLPLPSAPRPGGIGLFPPPNPSVPMPGVFPPFAASQVPVVPAAVLPPPGVLPPPPPGWAPA